MSSLKRTGIDSGIVFFASLPVITLTLLLAVPIIGMLAAAFLRDGLPSIFWFERILSSSFYFNPAPAREAVSFLPEANVMYITGSDFGVVLNSIIVASFVTAAGLLIGVPIAFLLARYSFPGRNLVRVISLVPLLVTPFINAHVVKKVLTPDGLLNWLLYDTLGILPWRLFIDGLAAVAVTQTLSYYPIIVLNVYSILMNIEPSLEEQAENLGASRLRLFRTVTLPLALPGIVAGASLVFIFSLEDLGGPIVFHGHPLARKLMSFQIYSSFISEAGERPPEIAALSVILLAIALAGFVIIRRYVSLRSYAAAVRGSSLQPRTRKVGVKGLALIYLVGVPTLLATAFPQFGVIALAFSRSWSGVLPSGFTLENLAQVFANPSVSSFVVNSLTYSLIATGIAVIIGFSSAYATNRLKIRGISLLDTFVTSPLALPGIVVAISYFYFFSSFFRGTPLDPTNPLQFEPALILILAYAMRRLPFTARAIYAGLQQVDPSLEEASMNLGASRIRTVLSIVAPLIVLSMVSGAIMSFIYSVSEVSVSITIGGLITEKGPLTVYMRDVWLSAVGSELIAASLGVLLIAMQLTSIIIVTLGLKQKYAFIGV